MPKKKLSTRADSHRRSVLFLPCYRDERMMQGVCRLAYEANWILDLRYYLTGQLPSSWNGDGILCMPQVPSYNTEINEFVRRHLHVTAVDLSLNDPSIDLPRVLQDNVGIGEIGAQHLISRGCRNFGFLIHSKSSFHQDRLKGYRERLRAAGHDVTAIWPPSEELNETSGTDWLLSQLPGGEGPFGIMVAADYTAQWIIYTCAQAGLSIPGDIAVLGVDNSREICELSPVAISSIDNNAFLQGYEGAKLLNELMTGQPAPSGPRLVPPGALHVRESTDIMATRHPHVAAAMRYIAESFTRRDLTPKSVAGQVPMSERRLHDAFLRFVGRSIYQEITHQRLQHALRLVQRTDRKLWDIAEASGFSSAELMSRLFRRQLGHPPSHYRQR